MKTGQAAQLSDPEGDVAKLGGDAPLPISAMLLGELCKLLQTGTIECNSGILHE